MKSKKAMPINSEDLVRWADGLIQASQSNLKTIKDKQFILTDDGYRNRLRHEVYVNEGFPDPVYYRGIFGRVHNSAEPRPTNRRRYSIDVWGQDVWESFHNEA